jgi:hypothetical protein
MAKAKKSALPDGCDLCEDNKGPLFLHARCHLTAPLQASMEDGVLTLRCYIPECGRVVAKFKVTDIVPSVGEQIAKRTRT